jgi:hypothetical protein
MTLCVLAPGLTCGAGMELQGQSKGSNTWISGNLLNWEAQDFIPCRVSFSGDAMRHQTVTIVFRRHQDAHSGFENLSGFTPSANVNITAGPVLSSPADADWTYTFTMDYDGQGAGHVEFLAQLAADAYRYPGSSLMLSGTPASMGRLLIHKPASRDQSPDPCPPQRIRRGQKLPPAGFFLEFETLIHHSYQVQYSEDLQSWKTAPGFIAGDGNVVGWIDQDAPETEGHPEAQSARFYRLSRSPCYLNDCELPTPDSLEPGDS